MPSDETEQARPPEMVEVYRASVTDARDTLAMLRSAGLSPEQVGSDDPNVDYASAWSQRVGIIVPADEVDEARELLDERDRRRAPGVQQATREYLGTLMIIALITAVVVAVAWIGGMGWSAVMLVIPVFFVANVLLGLLTRAFREQTSEQDDTKDDE